MDHQLGRKLSLAGEGVTHRTVIIDGQALLPRLGRYRRRPRSDSRVSPSRRSNPPGTTRRARHGPACHRLLFEHLPGCKDGAIDTLLTTKIACAMASLASFGGLGSNTAACHHVVGL